MPVIVENLIHDPHNIWVIFGRFNILIALTVIFWVGVRRGWNRRRWSLILLGFGLGATVGTYLLPSIIGSALGGLVGFLVLKRFLRFGENGSDLLVLALILIIGVGRIGCFLAGCCFGSPTDLPWGVCYNQSSAAWYLQHWTGQISETAATSLPVHPVQLYESIFLLGFVLPVFLWLNHRIRRKILLLTGFMGIYLLFRFGIEFIRDTTNIPLALVDFWGLSVLQWSLLTIGTGLLIWSGLAKRQPVPGIRPTAPANLSTTLDGVLLLSLTGITLAFSGQVPRILILLELYLLVLSLGVRILDFQVSLKFTRPYSFARLGQTGLVFGLLALVLATFVNQAGIAQFGGPTPRLKLRDWFYTVDPHTGKLVRVGDESVTAGDIHRLRRETGVFPDSTVSDSTIANNLLSDFQQKYWTFYTGGMKMSYSYIPACGGSRHYVDGYGFLAGLEKHRDNQYGKSYLGLRANYLLETNQSYASEYHAATSHTTKTWSLGAYGHVDYVWLGLGINGTFVSNPAEIPFYIEGRFLPGFYLRLGPKIFYAEAGFNDGSLRVPGPFVVHTGLGFTKARVGMMTIDPYIYSAGLYFELKPLSINEHLKLGGIISYMGTGAYGEIITEF